jgi:glyoxylase-like metal-dependent hydrolase (beta-lactamase superfamily II)/ferredoxin
MAKSKNRLPGNVPGEFYVDSSCIDCGACQWLAPGTFDDHRGMARVYRQPDTEAERIRALMSVVACPVAAIGTHEKQDYRPVEALFPELVEDPVYYCGYHSPKSFGAASYLIVRPDGNVLVDSPRYAKPLVDRLEAMGGLSLMFLTHSDDVADHEKFRKHFGCRRILHENDADPLTQDVEILLKGDAPVQLDDAITLIPIPGHTAGSTGLLYRDTFLFTGDHLSWDPGREALRASRSTCWFNWEKQMKSMERLARYRFEWVLPGHGVRCHLPHERMTEELKRCLGAMRAA